MEKGNERLWMDWKNFKLGTEDFGARDPKEVHGKGRRKYTTTEIDFNNG